MAMTSAAYGAEPALRILFIEDNATAVEYVKRGLGARGIEVDSCSDGVEGLERAMVEPYAIIVLDLGLPSMDGLVVLRRLRQAGVETPILVLSGRCQPSDRIAGLNLGADDYLAKPFALEELVARIRAIRRRVQTEEPPGELRVADLVLDTERHSVIRAGEDLVLTPKEFALLELLMRNEGCALSRSMITERVWGPAFEVSSHVISVHINHLRSKVDRGYDSYGGIRSGQLRDRQLEAVLPLRSPRNRRQGPIFQTGPRSHRHAPTYCRRPLRLDLFSDHETRIPASRLDWSARKYRRRPGGGAVLNGRPRWKRVWTGGDRRGPVGCSPRPCWRPSLQPRPPPTWLRS